MRHHLPLDVVIFGETAVKKISFKNCWCLTMCHDLTNYETGQGYSPEKSQCHCSFRLSFRLGNAIWHSLSLHNTVS